MEVSDCVCAWRWMACRGTLTTREQGQRGIRRRREWMRGWVRRRPGQVASDLTVQTQQLARFHRDASSSWVCASPPPLSTSVEVKICLWEKEAVVHWPWEKTNLPCLSRPRSGTKQEQLTHSCLHGKIKMTSCGSYWRCQQSFSSFCWCHELLLHLIPCSSLDLFHI